MDVARGASILFLIFLVSADAFADDTITYEELCKVDPLCGNIKDARGNFIPVSPALTRLLEEGRDTFIDHAERYGVDPRAVAGAIAAENTLNVQGSDLVQNWPNYFGYFVKNNLQDVTNAIGWDPVNKKRLKPRASEQLVKENGTFETPSSGVALLSAPPSCSMDGRAEAGRYAKIYSRREFPPVGSVRGKFKVAGRGVDCDLKDYVRVEFENGKRGWIQAALLHDEESGIKPPPPPCEHPPALPKKRPLA